MRLFCSDLGRVSAEPIAGSAPFIEKFLFISWPRKMWAETQYASKEFPEELKLTLIDLKKKFNVTTNLIYREGMSEKPFVILMPQNLLCEFSSIEEMRHTLAQNFRKNNFSRWQARSETSVFVCTHGKRDLCCAKYGFSVFKTLRSCSALDVWECTHLAADRFACNLVVLPVGDFYGRVREDDVQEIITSIQEGRTVPRLYRGNIFLEGVHQLVDAWVKSEGIQVKGIAFSFEGVDKAIAKITKPDGGELTVLCARREFTMHMDCQQLSEERKRAFKRWVLEG